MLSVIRACVLTWTYKCAVHTSIVLHKTQAIKCLFLTLIGACVAVQLCVVELAIDFEFNAKTHRLCSTIIGKTTLDSSCGLAVAIFTQRHRPACDKLYVIYKGTENNISGPFDGARRFVRTNVSWGLMCVIVIIILIHHWPSEMANRRPMNAFKTVLLLTPTTGFSVLQTIFLIQL